MTKNTESEKFYGLVNETINWAAGGIVIGILIILAIIAYEWIIGW